MFHTGEFPTSADPCSRDLLYYALRAGRRRSAHVWAGACPGGSFFNFVIYFFFFVSSFSTLNNLGVQTILKINMQLYTDEMYVCVNIQDEILRNATYTKKTNFWTLRMNSIMC